VLVVFGLSLGLLPGCNKGPALEAIAAAERELAAAPELAQHEPAEHAAISLALKQARASLDEGRYTDALRVAQALPDRVAAAAQSAARRKQQAQAEWGALAAALGPRLAALEARITALAAAGLAPERLAPARAELAAVSQSLAEAKAAFERGEIAGALAAGRDVRTRTERLEGRLGLTLSSARSAPPP
jgi:hypothetical protein